MDFKLTRENLSEQLQLMAITEITKLSPQEKAQYEYKLKIYRDLKNVLDTAYEEGKKKAQK